MEFWMPYQDEEMDTDDIISEFNEAEFTFC